MKGRNVDGLYTNGNISSTRLVLQLSPDLSCFLVTAIYVTIRIYVVLTLLYRRCQSNKQHYINLLHLISTSVCLHDHLQLPQHFKHRHIHQIRIKIEWTSINQKRHAAEVNRGDDGDSEQSPPKKRANLCECSNFLPGFRLTFT